MPTASLPSENKNFAGAFVATATEALAAAALS